MRKVKVGLIGCGNISDIYLKNARDVFQVLDVVACADRTEDKAKEKAKAYGIKAFPIDELLALKDIDIVLNLTVPSAHLGISMKALENGKHVYSEKPLAAARDEGRIILEKAKEKGLFVGCAPDTFLGGGLQTGRKLLDDGWIGTPFGAISFMIGGGPALSHPNPDFYYKKGAGPMLDMGPYYVTALVSLLGPVKRVTGMATTPFLEKTITGPTRYGQKIKVETPTYVSGTMEFRNGVCANLLTSFDLHYPYWDSHLPFIQIFGSEGTLSLPDPDTFGGPVLVRRFGGDFTSVPLTHGFLENSRGIGLADMAVSILRRKKPRANGDMAFHVLDVMTGFLDSARSGSHYMVTSTCERPEPLCRVLPKNSTEPAEGKG